jgi:hypothetical protein
MKFKIKYIYLIAFPVIVALLLFSAFSSLRLNEKQDAKGNEKIIKFSHNFHKDLAECDACHGAVKTSTNIKDRLLPNHDNCKTCHEVDKDDQCKTCHYGDNFEPLIQHRSKVYFNHSSHLNGQKLKCEECHKGITDVDYGFKAAQPYPIMENCYSCHNEKGPATSSCEGCHITTANLEPLSHQSVNFIKTHKFAAKESDANCVMCHDNNNNSCISCHSANNIILE